MTFKLLLLVALIAPILIIAAGYGLGLSERASEKPDSQHRPKASC
jgi:hypothetical protein